MNSAEPFCETELHILKGAAQLLNQQEIISRLAPLSSLQLKQIKGTAGAAPTPPGSGFPGFNYQEYIDYLKMKENQKRMQQK